jgi:hypothetical protein
MQRQRILDPGSGTQTAVVLDESVLQRRVGNDQVMFEHPLHDRSSQRPSGDV